MFDVRQRNCPGNLLRALTAAIAASLCLSAACAPAQEIDLPIGEVLHYRLYWGVIPVGTGALSTRWVKKGGRRLVAIRAEARTGPVVATIYPVDDVIESLVDPDTWLPVQYVERLSQGRERYHEVISFDHAAGKAHWHCLNTGVKQEVDIAPDTRDALSMMYRLRTRGVAPGEKASFQVLVDNRLYGLEIEAHGVEKVKVPGYGRRACLKVEPKARFGQIFIRRGRMQFWFSRDRRRVCTRIAGQIPLASVRAVLTGVEGPGDDSWVRGK
jgi:hypothetical protein